LKNTKSFESIIPTALYTAYPLIFTDIPFAKEMYNLLNEKGFPQELKKVILAPSLEARYKLIDKLCDACGSLQILELASGFTTRGLTRCLDNKNITYVELDLPSVIKNKQKMIKTYSRIPKNLHFVKGNALNKQDLNKCLKYFDITKPITVLNQGLMRYLNFDEKELERRKRNMKVFKTIMIILDVLALILLVVQILIKDIIIYFVNFYYVCNYNKKRTKCYYTLRPFLNQLI